MICRSSVGKRTCETLRRATLCARLGLQVLARVVLLGVRDVWFVVSTFMAGWIILYGAVQAGGLPLMRGAASAMIMASALAAVQATIFATTPPNDEGVGTMVTPASPRISTFSCADSPNAETIAPACPMRRPLGAERPAI